MRGLNAVIVDSCYMSPQYGYLILKCSSAAESASVEPRAGQSSDIISGLRVFGVRYSLYGVVCRPVVSEDEELPHRCS